ncbi:hypothetical protein BaRGS_00003556 [Batillaria attramentaria]|uniref:Uncharacterized protein n=1 Tax=Batillaria attramentaria TaxID=370345 RepID=A0ABD0M0W1_9CAEN
MSFGRAPIDTNTRTHNHRRDDLVYGYTFMSVQARRAWGIRIASLSLNKNSEKKGTGMQVNKSWWSLVAEAINRADAITETSVSESTYDSIRSGKSISRLPGIK